MGLIGSLIGAGIKGIKWIVKKIKARRERRRQEKAQRAFEAAQRKMGNPWNQPDTKTASPWGRVQGAITKGVEIAKEVQQGLQEESATNPTAAKVSGIIGKVVEKAPVVMGKVSEILNRNKEQSAGAATMPTQTVEQSNPFAPK